MLPKERRELILELLKENEKIEIEQLADKLGCSAMTIRRDLNQLENEEMVIRTHGGAVLNKPLIVETSFRVKEGKQHFEKMLIAKKALTIIEDQSTILLDSGTTTLEIAKLIKDKKNLTVVTNDIKIAAELMDSEVKVIVAGGELQNSVGALFGPVTEQILRNLHVDLCFLGTHAVHLKAGITATTFEKAFAKKLMIDSAETTWLVADSSKFQQKSLTKVCDLTRIDGIITDHGIPDEYQQQLKEHLEIIIADWSDET